MIFFAVGCRLSDLPPPAAFPLGGQLFSGLLAVAAAVGFDALEEAAPRVPHVLGAVLARGEQEVALVRVELAELGDVLVDPRHHGAGQRDGVAGPGVADALPPPVEPEEPLLVVRGPVLHVQPRVHAAADLRVLVALVLVLEERTQLPHLFGAPTRLK